MPRKLGTAKLQEFEVRITPRDQLPITEKEFKETFQHAIEYLFAAEGEPNGIPKLHYHGYVKASISESKMSDLCSKLGRADHEIRGNAIFMCKPKVHENLKGYVVKGRNVVATTYDQITLDYWMEKSDSYKREKEAEKKSASRSTKNTLDNILKEIQVDSSSTPFQVVSQILEQYSKLDLKFPPRSLIETSVLKKLYKDQQSFVVEHYAKNLQILHDNINGIFKRG